MPTFSACIYARKGGLPLKETLQSIARHVQEIIVAVPENNPSAIETAQTFFAQIVPYTPEKSRCATLQNAFSCAGSDFLLWLDEGDFFTPADLSKLRTLRQALHPDVDAARVKCAFTADSPDTVEHYRYETRLLARQASYAMVDDANPTLLINGNVVTYELTITHRQEKPENHAHVLSYYRARLEQNGTLTPRERLYYARALRDTGSTQTIGQYETLIQQDAPNQLRIAACLELAVCQTDAEKRLDILLHSFRFGPPQADICCLIGTYLWENHAFYGAIFWYELALSQKLPVTRRTIYSDYWGYIPALELCRCYYALGDTAKASACNRIAGEYKPGDAAVRYNEDFFTGLQRGAQKHRI